MEQQPQQQRKPINPKHIIEEQRIAIFDLTQNNIMLKAYVAQLEEEREELRGQLQERNEEPKEQA